MPISQTARDSQRDSADEKIEGLGAQALNLIDDFFDSPAHRMVKVSVFSQLVELLQQVDITSALAPGQLLSTDSVHQLTGGNTSAPAALTGGSAAGADEYVLTGQTAAKFRSMLQGYNGSADQLVDNFHSLLGSLQGVSSTQVAARSIAIAKVADGTIKVKDDGKLKLQEDLDAQSQKLTEEQAKTQRWSSDFGPLERKLRSGGADDALYGKRLTGLNDCASLLVSSNNGGFVVKSDGHVSLPTAAPAQSLSAADKKKLDDSASLLTFLKSHCHRTAGSRVNRAAPQYRIQFGQAELPDTLKPVWDSTPTS